MCEKLKLYLETTAFNYYFDLDRDHHEECAALFGEIAEGIHEAYTSAYVIAEIQKAPEPKRGKMLDLPANSVLRVFEPDNETENACRDKPRPRI